MRARRTRRTSLRSSVAWSATVVTAAWVLLLTVGANLLVGVALARTADDGLRARAEAASLTVDVSGERLVVREPQDDRALDTGTWVVGTDGAVVEAPAGVGTTATARAVEVARAALDGAAPGVVVRTVDLDDPTRLLALPVERDGRSVAAVVTSTSLNPSAQLRRLALVASVLAGLALLVVVHLVQRAALARALAPVSEMGAQVQRWSTDDPSQRLGSQDRPQELAALAGTLDGLLERIDGVLRHERLLTAELSHELRTPLAQLQAELDWLDAAPRSPGEQEDARAALQDAAARMRAVIEALLASARTSPAAAGRCQVLPALVEAVRETTGRQPGGDPDDVGPVVTVTAPEDLWAGAEAVLVQRALAPLLGNALRHAAARVRVSAERVSAERDGDRVVVTVDDDGPGIPAAVVDRVLEPGFRGDPADGHPGAGLGLALAHRLAVGAGGAVVPLAAGPRGGGRVQLVLPAG